MPSFEDEVLSALAAERRLAEERALIPGLMQHDLANVLCEVGLTVSILEHATTDLERGRAIREVQGGLKRMNDLLSGMRFLYLNRGGANDYARGDLAAFVMDLVHTPGAWPKGSPITLDLPPTMWCTFSPTLVRHSLVNLIGNAVTYSRDTWVRVRLARICGSRWQIAVANGGPGVPANHLPYLFELGTAMQGASKVGCPGLGLYIARLCVRFHGSALRVRSRPGLTVFSFALEGAQRSAKPQEPGRGESDAA